MELVTKKKLELYSGDSHPALAQEIAEHLGLTLGEANLRQFANGELHCRYGESIRGADVFIIQTHAGPHVNDALMQQLIMIDAAKRASAKRITAVCPYYATPARTARPRAGSPSPPSWWPTCSRPLVPIGWCRSTCTPARSRASSMCQSIT